MTEKNLDVQKQEIKPGDNERTRDTACFAPLTDIFENDDAITLKVEMPGVSQEHIDIVLEKNKLTIRGYIESQPIEDHSLLFAEYGIGDYERSFVIPNEIDREKIEAVVKNGVLSLVLPKQEEQKTRKIAVKTV